jgi:hypothetical protein
LPRNPFQRQGVAFAATPIPAVAANMESKTMNDPNNRNPGQQREQQQREQQQRQNQRPDQQPGQKPGQKQDQRKSDMDKERRDNPE